jgi:dimethylamine corrinoid protein
MQEQEELFERLADAVLQLDEDGAKALAREVVARGVDAWDAIERGLLVGMQRAGKLFDEEEYFVPELLVAADAMYGAIELLRPHIREQGRGERRRIVIGVMQGDTHDIGKNLVRIMLEVSGFEVHDLGRDVAPRAFVDRAVEVGADVIALSTLMTTTMGGMAEVIRILEAEALRTRFKVIVGGSPISQQFADRIGADGYAPRAAEAVQLARRLVGLGEAA